MSNDTQTKRECLVRSVALSRGITMTKVAEEMKIAKTTLHGALTNDNPRPPTLNRIRVWLNRYRRHLPEGVVLASNHDLVG